MFRKVFVLFLVATFMLPAFWSIVTSFKSMSEIYSYPPTIFPKKISFEGYLKIFRNYDFITYLKNTLFVATVATLITVLICVMTGYGLAKGNFPGKQLLTDMMLTTLFITAEIMMVPLFIIIKKLNLVNNLWGLIVPAVYTPTGTFTAIQYMKDIPDELLESAKIDGANEWQIFWRIVVPLSKPLIAALAIFSFTWRWNDFILPLMVVNDSKLYTIQLALAGLQGQYDVPWNAVMAFSTLAILPPLIIFLAFQKLFMRGIMSGGLKY